MRLCKAYDSIWRPRIAFNFLPENGFEIVAKQMKDGIKLSGCDWKIRSKFEADLRLPFVNDLARSRFEKPLFRIKRLEPERTQALTRLAAGAFSLDRNRLVVVINHAAIVPLSSAKADPERSAKCVMVLDGAIFKFRQALTENFD